MAKTTLTPLELADGLHSAAIHLLRGLRSTDTASGLSGPRLSALSVLVFGGPRSLGELAAAEQVRPATMSRLVALMESEGLVKRETQAEDRRAIRLQATALGKRLLLAGRERRVGTLATRLSALSARDLQRLAHALPLLQRLARGD